MSPVIQSFKKVLNFGPVSLAVGLGSFTAVKGVDSVAAGQTGVSDPDVPTGSIVKYIEFQHAIGQHLSDSPAFINIAIERLEDGQAIVNPAVVGGNPRRNQVFFQALFQLGKFQNFNRVYRFKIPKKFQRVREGTTWSFNVNSDLIGTQALQIIYKFYR